MKCYTIQFGSGNIQQFFAKGPYEAGDFARSIANAKRDSVRNVMEVEDQASTFISENIDQIQENTTEIKYQLDSLKELLEEHLNQKNNESDELLKQKKLITELKKEINSLSESNSKIKNILEQTRQKESEKEDTIQTQKELIELKEKTIKGQELEFKNLKNQIDKFKQYFIPRIDFKIQEWDDYIEPLKGTETLKITNKEMYDKIKSHLLIFNPNAEDLIDRLIKIALDYINPQAYTTADVRDLQSVYTLIISEGDFAFTQRALNNYFERISSWPPLYQYKY